MCCGIYVKALCLQGLLAFSTGIGHPRVCPCAGEWPGSPVWSNRGEQMHRDRSSGQTAAEDMTEGQKARSLLKWPLSDGCDALHFPPLSST